MPNNEAKDILNETLRRAAVDASFRKLAVADPRKAMETVHGGPFLKLAPVRFVDNSTETVKTIVLPPPVDAGQEMELSDAELEVVAGGFTDCKGTAIITL